MIHYGFQAIALFNADEHVNALDRVRQLAADCPNADTLACRVVEVSIVLSLKPRFVGTDFSELRADQAYLNVQMGEDALKSGRYSEAADRFTAAVNNGAFSFKSAIHSTYEDFVVVC